MAIPEKLQELGLELPPAPQPVGSYVPAMRTGNLLYTSGQLPTRQGKLLHTGKLTTEVTVEQAQQCARQAVLNALAAVSTAIDDVTRIRRVVRMTCYVNSAEGFTGQSQVANAASDLLVALMDQSGRHTRCAVGVGELPLDSPLELDLILEVD
ncbi:MAG: RidA family protein [Planctomycetota bacterium]